MTARPAGETIVWGTATDRCGAVDGGRDGGNDLGAEMELDDEVTLDAWPEDLRDSAWAAGQPRTTARPGVRRS